MPGTAMNTSMINEMFFYISRWVKMDCKFLEFYADFEI